MLNFGPQKNRKKEPQKARLTEHRRIQVNYYESSTMIGNELSVRQCIGHPIMDFVTDEMWARGMEDNVYERVEAAGIRPALDACFEGARESHGGRRENEVSLA